jgi:hypothetical protein
MLPGLSEQEMIDRTEEIIVAFGAGWGRRIDPAGDIWDGRWLPALDRVTRQVHGWMKATAAWLHFDVRLPGYARIAPFPIWEEAQMVARHLWLGTCDCWRLRYPDDDTPRSVNAKKRAARCLREHRLSAWKPHKGITLWNFIASAVKGDKPAGNRTGQKGFSSGTVEQGMFYCDLYRYYDVRLGKVLIWYCPRHPKAYFELENQTCRECKDEKVYTTFNELHTRHEVVRRLLVKAPTGSYQEQEYWRCQKQECGNYYRVNLDLCPLLDCQHRRTRGAAKSTVRVLGRDEPLSSDPDGIPIEIKQILEKAITAVMGVLPNLDEYVQIVWQVVCREISEAESAQKLGWKPKQIRDVAEKFYCLYLEE